MRQVKMYLCCMLWILLQHSFAENIYFNFSNGTTAVFPVPDVRSITFTADTMHLNKRDGTVISWPVFSIGHYDYNQVSTGIQNSSNTNLKIYPNPSDGIMMFKYELKSSQKVVLELWDLNGNSIRKIADQYTNPGQYNISWDGNDKSGNAVASGTYICALTIGTETVSGKITIIHK